MQEPGAVVGKDVYHLDLGTATLNGLLLVAGVGVWIAYLLDRRRQTAG